MPGHYGMSFGGEGGRQTGFSSGRNSPGRQETDRGNQSSSRRTSNAPRQYSVPTTRSSPATSDPSSNSPARTAAAIREVQAREANNPLRNLPSILAGVGSFTRNRIIAELEKGGTPVYKDGIVIGVEHEGFIPGTTVYTGRQRDDNMGGDDDDNQRSAAAAAPAPPAVNTPPPAAPPVIAPPVDAPAPPGDAPVDNTTDAAVDARRKRGRQTTVATSAQGLLTPARTRRRSLMGGLIR